MTGKIETPTVAVTTKRRIIALDLMRGYFILLIGSIHLAYYPSFFGAVDGRGQLWVSEAEGFFLISGLLIGIIRRNYIRKLCLGLGIKRMLGRGWKLYLASVILSVLYLVIGRTLTAYGIEGAKGGLDIATQPFELIWRVISLQYSYGWADFLGYYAAYMFMAPIVLWLFFKKLWWIVGVLSLFVYVLRWSGDFGWLNPFLQWQVYFFLGSIIGYNWGELNSRFKSVGTVVQKRLSAGVMLASVSIMAISLIVVVLPTFYSANSLPAGLYGHFIASLKSLGTNVMYDHLFLNNRIGLLRPVLALVVLAGLFAFVIKFETVIMKTIGKLLLPYGQNSLYVYVLQSACLFIVPFFLLAGNFYVNTAIEIGLIIVIFLAVKKKFLFRVIPR